MTTKVVFACDRCSAEQRCVSGTVVPTGWAHLKVDRKDGMLSRYGEGIHFCPVCHNRFRDWMQQL